MTQLTNGRTASTMLAMALLLSIEARADAMQDCLLRKLDSGSQDATAREMRDACRAELSRDAPPSPASRG